ncbi:autotransporter domain-containing protein [Helicobacter aurati]|uniref:Autotransporter domain-containing protein n=2 Tax=Helicobacter aurati TaxID=137778 RepID=A0A3D8J7V6_9HELI|nr:autotransporter domain-containing protein [Helicobacter aurati]
MFAGTFLTGTFLQAAQDIQNNIYNLNDQNNNANDIFYSQNMGSTWSSLGANFIQNYQNGTLIIGNSSKSPAQNNRHWFGTGGWLGYINATFNVKEAYLTGIIGSGNNARTGGGANLIFNASNLLTLDGATIQIYKAGTQNSTTFLYGNTIDVRNSSFILEGNLAGGGLNTVRLGSDATRQIMLKNTSIRFDSITDVGPVLPQLIIKSNSNQSEIDFSSITGKRGRITFEKDQYKTFSAQTVNVEDIHINSNRIKFHGDIRGGTFKLGTDADTYFNASTLIVTDNSQITANRFNVDAIELWGGASNLITRTNRELTLNSNNQIHIKELRNSDYVAFQTGGFTATLKTNARTEIDKITMRNFTAGNTMNVETSGNNNLIVGSLNYVTDGIAGSSARVKLQALDGNVILRDVSGCNSLCVGSQGIRALNFLQIVGKNFYAGKVEAMGLVTAGSNSTLDARQVNGTTFIDDFYIRSGTLYASDFHINNFTVWKGNANRVGFAHPTAGSAFSAVDYHIGKSFINYLSLEIGTSHTADSAALWFRQGGEILNYNLIDARSTSYLNMSGINQVNINQLTATETSFYLKNAIFNTIINKKGQTIISSDTQIEANALNINELLWLKDGSKNSGIINIRLNGNQDVNQDFSKYLSVNVDSTGLKAMNKEQLQTLITESARGTTAPQSDYQNASGTYITTKDNKHYLLLPDIMSHEEVTNSDLQVANGGNLLIEQTKLKKGTLGNYGKILLDAGFVEGVLPIFTLVGNLDNYNTIDVGANGRINMTGDFANYGTLIFRLQANPKDAKITDVKNGVLNITGNAMFDVSMGTPGAFQADILDMKSLNNLKLATPNRDASQDPNTYRLINVTGNINYTFTQGDYTTTFNKTNNNYAISTVHKESTANNNKCVNSNCVIIDNGQTKQETYYTMNKGNNPWDMDKAQVDSIKGNRLENEVGSYDNLGNLIQKPSQSDKQKACDTSNPNAYCGFADKNASEAERGYNYAQERMKNSFSVTYKGASIDGKYLQVEKVVTGNMMGFRILRRDITDFTQGNAETPLCTKGSSTFDCVLYMEAGGNNSWINAIKKESANSYDILKDLFYNENSAILFLINVDQSLAASRNLNYFLEVARTLDSTFQHVSDLQSKSSTLNTLALAMDSARINRLTRVSSLHGVGVPIKNQEVLAFEEYQRKLKKELEIAQKIREQKNLSLYNDALREQENRQFDSKVSQNDGYFSSSNNDSGIAIVNTNSAFANFIIPAALSPSSKQTNSMPDMQNDDPEVRTKREHSMNFESTGTLWFESLSDLVTRFNKRGEYPNNAWVNALGDINFSTSGTAQLYGVNAGYDYFITSIHTAIGGYAGYGYGIFKGGYNGFVSNTSNNIFAGLYSRTFIHNQKIDITVNSAFGFVNEELSSGVPNMELLNLFGQRYGYNITNLEANVSYGYAFSLTKGYILKPFLGVNYYSLESSNLNHNGATTSDFLVDTHNNARKGLGVIVGVEGRKYWANQSYVFLLGQLKQDVAILQSNLNETGHATTQAGVVNGGNDLGSVGAQNMLYVNYAKENLQSSLFIAGGGEYALGRFYVNGSMNFQNAMFEKNFGLGFNLGARVIF